MALTETEIQRLIEKLREKYHDYAGRQNARWFNVEPFEERLQMALRNRMNLEGFILAEITAFEKLRERYDKKKNEKPFSATVDSIIEENTARIKRYPRIEFHPRAGLEISHFYGAMAGFALYYFPVMWLLDLDESLKKALFRFEDNLNFLAIPQGSRPSKRIGDHMLVLSRQGIRELDIERDASDYLKMSAILLHEIIDFCQGLLDRRNSDWEVPLGFSKLYVEDTRKKKIVDIFSGTTGYGALITVSSYARDIIEDFRLKAFRK